MWRNTPSLLGESVACFIFLVALCDAHRFLTQNRASQFLSRHRRANSMFEESKKGNLERECIEELCNKEEAREIFENYPETEHFYPQYVFCLGSHRVGINNQNSGDSNVPSNLRTCVKEISDQCLPFPCYKEGSERCIDGQASFTCQCRPGWKGPRCEDDIDECSDPDHQADCNQKCYNSPGSFRCMCDDGYRFRTSEKIHCTDINECLLYPSICEEPAKCVNNPGMYECQCPPGFSYNFTLRSCLDVDECEVGVCEGVCVNTMGSYSCRCEGRQGLRLAEDQRSCEEVPVCVQLYDYKHPEMLYLGEQFTGGPVIYLRFRLPENTKFAAEFDFRTFDPEGVVLYAESSQDSWFMLGLRGGRIEVQFKTQHSLKVTSGGKAINDGQWHVISVDELESSISVKISKEAVMSINSPESLFTSVNGKLETKVYIAGLPNRTDSVIKPINPRLDGCIRGWNLMNQGASGVKEVIQEKKSKHCFLHVERGTYFTGAGLAHFNVDYRESGRWRVDLKMHIRPSSSTGVLFALVLNDTVPLSVAVVTQGPDEADLQVFLDGVSVATLQSLMLCYPDRLSVELTVTPTSLEIVANTSTWSYSLPDGALDRLNNTMMTHSVRTCIGGLPGVLQSHRKVLSAGMKTYEVPPDYSEVVLPERPKLKFLNKVPNFKKARKEMKKLRDIQGPAQTANTFTKGQYGIVALGGGYLHFGHMEMMRLTINRRMDPRTTFARWRINAPYKPITRKGLGQRMGGGKGNIDHYVTPVKYGRMIVEVGGRLELGEVEPILKEVAKKLPFPAKVVSRESLAAMQQEQQDMEQNNQNPWTFQRIARGNMLGVRRVLSPFDLHNHGKYSGKFHNPGRV